MSIPTTSSSPAKSASSYSERSANLRAGVIAGFLVGSLVGITIWTHAPDKVHFLVALAIMFVGALVGFLVGILINSLPSETAHRPKDQSPDP